MSKTLITGSLVVGAAVGGLWWLLGAGPQQAESAAAPAKAAAQPAVPREYTDQIAQQLDKEAQRLREQLEAHRHAVTGAADGERN